MEIKIDTDKEYALVLEGGGAKGAYQIGAWKALKECGIRVNAVAGTSVGALNGALICMGDVDKAEKIWENITYSQVMDVDDNLMKSVFEGKIGQGEAIKEGLRILTEGGMDITPLKRLIADNIDEDFIRKSKMEFFMLAYSITERKELDLNLKEIPAGELSDFLLASAYLPVFKNEEIKGRKYMDGGMFNNVPLESLVKRGYKDIIMLRIYGPGRKKKVDLPEDLNLYAIEPRNNLGKVLDFNATLAKRNIRTGYYDAMRLLYGLEGLYYYINDNQTEDFFARFLDRSPELVGRLLLDYDLQDKYQDDKRAYLEGLLPAIASELKLGKDWTYKQLYIHMAEKTARKLRMPRYKIYDLDQFEQEIRLQWHRMEEPQDLYKFSEFLLYEKGI